MALESIRAIDQIGKGKLLLTMVNGSEEQFKLRSPSIWIEAITDWTLAKITLTIKD
jgi:hypothetical protein